MTDQEKRDRIADLGRKLSKRRGVRGYEKNILAIEEEITRLRDEEPSNVVRLVK